MSNPSSQVLTSAETASALGVSVKTVTRWVVAGKLHPVKRLPGRRGAFLFDGDEVASLRGAGGAS